MPARQLKPYRPTNVFYPLQFPFTFQSSIPDATMICAVPYAGMLNSKKGVHKIQPLKLGVSKSKWNRPPFAMNSSLFLSRACFVELSIVLQQM